MMTKINVPRLETKSVIRYHDYMTSRKKRNSNVYFVEVKTIWSNDGTKASKMPLSHELKFENSKMASLGGILLPGKILRYPNTCIK